MGLFSLLFFLTHHRAQPPAVPYLCSGWHPLPTGSHLVWLALAPGLAEHPCAGIHLHAHFYHPQHCLPGEPCSHCFLHCHPPPFVSHHQNPAEHPLRGGAAQGQVTRLKDNGFGTKGRGQGSFPLFWVLSSENFGLVCSTVAPYTSIWCIWRNATLFLGGVPNFMFPIILSTLKTKSETLVGTKWLNGLVALVSTV